jgi:hypothetical protein
VGTYSAGEGSEDGGEPRAFVSVNWLLTEEPLDLETELVGGGKQGGSWVEVGLTKVASLGWRDWKSQRQLMMPKGTKQCCCFSVCRMYCLRMSQPYCSDVPPPLVKSVPQALGFLNHLMLGTSASPLRKALNDSGLGESLIGGGVEDELAQPVFSLGLKVGAGVVWWVLVCWFGGWVGEWEGGE